MLMFLLSPDGVFTEYHMSSMNPLWRAAHISITAGLSLACVTEPAKGWPEWGSSGRGPTWETAALMCSPLHPERDCLLSSIRRSHSAGTNPHPSKTSDHHVIVHSDTLQGPCFHIMKPSELPTARLIITPCTVCVCVCVFVYILVVPFFFFFTVQSEGFSINAHLCVHLKWGCVFFCLVCVLCPCARKLVDISAWLIPRGLFELGLCI